MKYITILIVYFLLAVIIQIIFKINPWSNKEEKNTTIIWLAFIFIFGLLTDYYASVTNRIWVFSENGIIGVRFFTLPIEEYLFLLIVPYFALVLYKALIKLFSINK